MRLVLMLLLAALVPCSGLAGAWPRPEGQTFVAFSFSGSADLAEVQTGGECPIFCVTALWSMLPERSKDDDDFQGITERTAEGLRAA